MAAALQHHQVALIASTSTTGTRGSAMAGSATPTSYAGNSTAGAKRNPKLT